jgi:energy-converting hydrogenase Eha subunit E
LLSLDDPWVTTYLNSEVIIVTASLTFPLYNSPFILLFYLIIDVNAEISRILMFLYKISLFESKLILAQPLMTVD